MSDECINGWNANYIDKPTLILPTTGRKLHTAKYNQTAQNPSGDIFHDLPSHPVLERRGKEEGKVHDFNVLLVLHVGEVQNDCSERNEHKIDELKVSVNVAFITLEKK